MSVEHTPGPWTIKPNPREIDIAPAFQNTLQVIAFAGTEDKEFIAELSHEANARLIAAAPETKDQRDELLKACKAQHEAIDRLFALLISHDSGFFPSKSGQPWQAILQGNAAIAEAEKQA